MKLLWRKWCDKVDKHNALIKDTDAIDYYWDYMTIFAPVWQAILLGLMSLIILRDKIITVVIIFVVTLVVFSLVYWFNWWIIEKENQEEAIHNENS